MMLFATPSHVLRVSALNFTAKLILFTTLFYIEAQLYPGLQLSGPALVAIALALTMVGTIADLLIVPLLGNLPALTLGFFGMTFIIWFVAIFFPTTQITLVNAMFMSLPLGPVEYFLHRYILDSLVH